MIITNKTICYRWNTINNIYLKKTINHILNNLEPRFKKIEHTVSSGETFDNILENYSDINEKQVDDWVDEVCITEVEFWIYDRWGKLVYYTEEIEVGWDGYFEGLLLNNDTYSWRLKYNHDGEIMDENGFVLLLR
mgnify:CR=1 FL=1